MSLINDALKKAQRDREAGLKPTDATAPGGDTSVKQASSFKLSLWILGLFGVLAVSSFSVWLTLRLSSKDEPAKPAPVTASPVATPSPAPTAVVVQQTPPPAAVPALIVKTPAPVVVAQAPAATPPPALPASPTPGLSPEAEKARLQAMVNRLRISGIRISDTGNRALINDRLVRTGDLLDPDSGLRLVSIVDDQLNFVDAAGRTYTRRK